MELYQGHDGKWYWTDEMDMIIGPYPNKESAEDGFEFYAAWLNQKSIDNLS